MANCAEVFASSSVYCGSYIESRTLDDVVDASRFVDVLLSSFVYIDDKSIVHVETRSQKAVALKTKAKH
jgi:hypothetical protein